MGAVLALGASPGARAAEIAAGPLSLQDDLTLECAAVNIGTRDVEIAFTTILDGRSSPATIVVRAGEGHSPRLSTASIGRSSAPA